MATTMCTPYHLAYLLIKAFEMTSLLLNSQLLYGLINVNVVLMQKIQLGTTPVNTVLVIWSLLRASQALIQARVRSVRTWMQSLIDLFSFTVCMAWCDNAPSSPVGWACSFLSSCCISWLTNTSFFVFAWFSSLFHVSPVFVFMFEFFFCVYDLIMENAFMPIVSLFIRT